MELTKMRGNIWTDMPKELLVLLAKEMNCLETQTTELIDRNCYRNLPEAMQTFNYHFYEEKDGIFSQRPEYKIENEIIQEISMNLEDSSWFINDINYF